MSCDEEAAAQFLYKYNYYLEENKSFPGDFIKKSKNAFNKNQKRSLIIEKNQFFFWKNFCKNNNYEQVLPVVLFGILKYPKKQISWFLKVLPEDLSYRLEEGFLILGEELIKTSFDNTDDKEMMFTSGLRIRTEKEKKALIYCNWLAEQALPDLIEPMVPKKRYKTTKYLLLGFLFLASLSFFIWILTLIFPPSAKIILYQSFIDGNF